MANTNSVTTDRKQRTFILRHTSSAAQSPNLAGSSVNMHMPWDRSQGAAPGRRKP